MGSNEEVDPGSREDVNEGGATSESYQSFACHDGGGDMSVLWRWRKGKQLKHEPEKIQTMLQFIKANKKEGNEGLIG